MTVGDIKERLELKALCESEESLSREVTGGYCGDLLSWVMSRAAAGDAWMTVMGNVNAIGVAALADIACIILTESAPLDEDARIRAEQKVTRGRAAIIKAYYLRNEDPRCPKEVLTVENN